MKKHVFFQRLLIFLISAAMILSLTSCGQKKPIPTPKEEENKPPKELEELSKAVEAMEKKLSDMYERSKKPLFIQQQEIMKQTQKEGEEHQHGSKEDGGEKGQQQSSGQKGSTVELVTPEAQQMQTQLEMKEMQKEIEKATITEFEQLNKDVLKLHSLWNAFEAKAMSQLMMQTAITDFENTLNNLTKSLSNSDVYISLMDVTQLYKYLPDFYATYKPEAPTEIGKLRFAAKKIYLLSDKEEFDAAKEVFDYLNSVWMVTKPKLSKDNKDMMNQMEFAFTDLKNALDSRNNVIVKAKTDVIVKLSDELEKASEKEEKK